MTLILDKTLLRLGVHISSIRYLEDGTSHFTKVTKHNNINFDCKVFNNEDGKKDGKEAVTNSEEEASKKRHNIKYKKMCHGLYYLLLCLDCLFLPLHSLLYLDPFLLYLNCLLLCLNHLLLCLDCLLLRLHLFFYWDILPYFSICIYVYTSWVISPAFFFITFAKDTNA